MQYCTECRSVEQGTIEMEYDGEIIEVCSQCQMPEETMVNFDEDYGQER